MKFFRIIRVCLLLLCTPAVAVPHEHPLTTLTQEKENAFYIPRDESGNVNPWKLFQYDELSFENILGFVNALQEDSFWENLSLDELDVVADYLTWSMSNYAPSYREDLQEKAQEAIDKLEAILLDDGSFTWYLQNTLDDHDFLYGYNSLQAYDYIMRCGWLSKKWKQLKNWVKENKEPLIICAVVGTALVVGAVTGGVGASSAVAVGGALAGTAGSGDDQNSSETFDPTHINKPGEVIFQEDLPPLPSIPPPSPPNIASHETLPPLPPLSNELSNAPAIKDLELPLIVDEKKEQMLINIELHKEEQGKETSSQTWSEYLRDTGCSLGHTIVDSVASAVEYFYYEDAPLHDYVQFLCSVEGYHDKVDQAFTFDAEAKQFDKWQVQTGTPPAVVPGGKALVQGGKAAGTAVGGAIIGELLTTTAATPLVIEQGNISVYRAFNELTNEVSYVGISNNWERRALEHARQKEIEIEPIIGLEGLSPYDARATEQALIELHKLEKDGGTLINKINSIGEKNPIKAEALERGFEILKSIDYEGLEGISE